MAYKVRVGGNWVNVTQPKVWVGGVWTNCTSVKARVGGAWSTVWTAITNVRDSNSPSVTLGTNVDYSLTRDGSFGDTSTYGYCYPTYYGDTAVVTTSFSSQAVSSATLYVQTGYEYYADNRLIVSASASMEYNIGNGWVGLRSTPAIPGTATATGQSAVLSGLGNLSNLQIKWTGSAFDGYDPYDNYYVAFARIRVYDVYVAYNT